MILIKSFFLAIFKNNNPDRKYFLEGLTHQERLQHGGLNMSAGDLHFGDGDDDGHGDDDDEQNHNNKVKEDHHVAKLWWVKWFWG